MVRRFLILLLLLPCGWAQADDALLAAAAALDRGEYAVARGLLLPLAEEGGNGEAQFLLGRLYLDGHGDGRGDGVAVGVEWLDRAVASGHREAALMLGNLYLSGLGVRADPERGAAYLERAAGLLKPAGDDGECD